VSTEGEAWMNQGLEEQPPPACKEKARSVNRLLLMTILVSDNRAAAAHIFAADP